MSHEFDQTEAPLNFDQDMDTPDPDMRRSASDKLKSRLGAASLEPAGLNAWLLGVAVVIALLLLAILLRVWSRPDAIQQSAELQPVVTFPTGSTPTSTSPLAQPTASAPAELLEPCSGRIDGIGGSGTVEDFMAVALAQVGKPYVYGSEAAPTDPDPESFDLSELVQWASARAGVTFVDGSWIQYLALQDCGAAILVAEAAYIKGALLFGFSGEPVRAERPEVSSVVIALGDGKTVIGHEEGLIAIRSIESLTLTHAARLPDLKGQENS